MVYQDEKTGETVFSFTPKQAAKKVFLAGDFNDWNPTGRRMVKGKGGTFRARLQLPPGRYEYKFVVDDAWVLDAEAPEHATNSFGSINSVVVVADLCGASCDCESKSCD
jgi:1,4-alpha-glucan branching enzyme